MNDSAIKTLEFRKIVERLADQASSERGKERCLSLDQSVSLGEIEDAQTQTADAVGRLLKNSSVSFYAGEMIFASLTRLDKGSTISAAELLQIARLLENVARIKSYGRRDINETGEDSLDTYCPCWNP